MTDLKTKLNNMSASRYWGIVIDGVVSIACILVASWTVDLFVEAARIYPPPVMGNFTKTEVSRETTTTSQRKLYYCGLRPGMPPRWDVTTYGGPVLVYGPYKESEASQGRTATELENSVLNTTIKQLPEAPTGWEALIYYLHGDISQGKFHGDIDATVMLGGHQLDFETTIP